MEKNNYIDSEHLLMLVRQAEASGYAKAVKEFESKLFIAKCALEKIHDDTDHEAMWIIARDALKEIQ